MQVTVVTSDQMQPHNVMGKAAAHINTHPRFCENPIFVSPRSKRRWWLRGSLGCLSTAWAVVDGSLDAHGLSVRLDQIALRFLKYYWGLCVGDFFNIRIKGIAYFPNPPPTAVYQAVFVWSGLAEQVKTTEQSIYSVLIINSTNRFNSCCLSSDIKGPKLAACCAEKAHVSQGEGFNK